MNKCTGEKIEFWEFDLVINYYNKPIRYNKNVENRLNSK